MVNIREGSRRLALLLGGAGFVVGLLIGYFGWQSAYRLERHTNEYTSLSWHPVIRADLERLRQGQSSRSRYPSCAEYRRYKESRKAQDQRRQKGTAAPHAEDEWKFVFTDGGPSGPSYLFCYDESAELRVEEIIDISGRTVSWHDRPNPTWEENLWIVASPLLGLLLPWGLIRSLAWVVLGFTREKS